MEENLGQTQNSSADNLLLFDDNSSAKSEDLMQDENRNRWTFQPHSSPPITSRQRPRCYESDQSSHQSMPSLESTNIDSLEELAQDSFSAALAKPNPLRLLGNKVLVSTKGNQIYWFTWYLAVWKNVKFVLRGTVASRGKNFDKFYVKTQMIRNES